MKKPIVVGFVAGPGSGKSTLAAGLFYELKKKGVNCELITEYAKDRVFEENYKALDDQLYIFAKQHHRQYKLNNSVDVIITDAPLILSLYYGKHLTPNFIGLVKETFNNYNNKIYFLSRMHKYQTIGRLQNEKEAKKIDLELLELLDEHNIEYEKIQNCDQTVQYLIEDIIDTLKRNNC